MDQPNAQKKIGNTDIQVSLDFLKELRQKVRAQTPGISYRVMAQNLQADFPKISFGVLETYVPAIDRASDYILDMLWSGKISILVFQELCSGDMDTGTRDTFANMILEKWVNMGGRKMRMGPKHVRMVKKILKTSKGRCSLAEAVMRATGEIPGHARPEHVEETKKSFGKAVASSTDAAVKFMTAMQMALDLIPGSAVESGEIHLDSYEKLTTFENTLENALNFVRSRRKQWLEWLKSHVVAEATMAQERLGRGG